MNGVCVVVADIRIACAVGEPLKRLQLAPEVEACLTGIRNRMDAAYTNELDGKIAEYSGNSGTSYQKFSKRFSV
jgi:hypothetical protein